MNEPAIDEVIHSPNRLKICALLFPLQFLEFHILRDELQVSDSVLSKHIKRLEDAGYVKQRKGSENGRKRSWVHMTAKGKKAFKLHVEALQNMISLTESG